MTVRQQWAIRDRRSGVLHPPRYATRGQAEARIEELNSPDWLDAWPLRGES